MPRGEVLNEEWTARSIRPLTYLPQREWTTTKLTKVHVSLGEALNAEGFDDFVERDIAA